MISGDISCADIADRMVSCSDSLLYATIYFKVARILSKLVGSEFTFMVVSALRSWDQPAGSPLSQVADFAQGHGFERELLARRRKGDVDRGDHEGRKKVAGRGHQGRRFLGWVFGHLGLGYGRGRVEALELGAWGRRPYPRNPYPNMPAPPGRRSRPPLALVPVQSPSQFALFWPYIQEPLNELQSSDMINCI